MSAGRYDQPGPYDLDTSIPTDMLMTMHQPSRPHVNPLLRRSAPWEPMHRNDRRETQAREALRHGGYEPASTTASYASYHNRLSQQRDEVISRASPNPDIAREPVGATLASWQRYLPRNAMLPVLAANAHPHVNNMPYSTAGAAATDGLVDPFGATTAAGAVKGKLPSDWVVSPSPVGILIRRDHHTSAAIARVRRQLRRSDVVTRHVSDATVHQIDYFSTRAAPPLRRSQVLQRLQTQSPPGASPRPIFTGATASSYVSDRDIASALASGRMEFDPDLDNPAYLAAAGLSRMVTPDDREHTPRPRQLPEHESAHDGGAPVESEPEPHSDGGARLARHQLHLTVPEVSDEATKRVIVVVPHQQRIQGGGWVWRRPQPNAIPKWRAHAEHLAEVQAREEEAAAARAHARRAVPRYGTGSRAPRFQGSESYARPQHTHDY